MLVIWNLHLASILVRLILIALMFLYKSPVKHCLGPQHLWTSCSWVWLSILVLFSWSSVIFSQTNCFCCWSCWARIRFLLKVLSDGSAHFFFFFGRKENQFNAWNSFTVKAISPLGIWEKSLVNIYLVEYWICYYIQ